MAYLSLASVETPSPEVAQRSADQASYFILLEELRLGLNGESC